MFSLLQEICQKHQSFQMRICLTVIRQILVQKMSQSHQWMLVYHTEVTYLT